MTNGDLLRQLFQSHVKKDDAAFSSVAEAIVREERSRNHRMLADDLERILRQRNGHTNGTHRGAGLDVPKDRERGFPLFTVSEYDYAWDRLVVSTKITEALQRLAEEYRRKDVLVSAGLRPQERVLFLGPPGCGKTLAAKVLSSALGYPLITVRFDAVISSYLGETAANLRKVFDFLERGQWVVLFDEFDAIGKERDSSNEHGELKRVVSSLLQLMDAHRGESVLIAATNHWSMLDSAIWRRFDMVLPFNLPSPQDRALMLRLFLRGFDTEGLDARRIAKQLDGASGADVERVAICAARRAVLDGRRKIAREDIALGVAEYKDRHQVLTELNPLCDATSANESKD